jgi:hypothetical protein
MVKSVAVTIGLSISLVLAVVVGGGNAFAQCYGSLMLSPGYFEYDYLVRLAVHFGDVSALPDAVQCSRVMTVGESPIEVPIFMYNLHEGIDYLEFSVESNDSIAEFVPENCFSIVRQDYYVFPGYYQLNIKLSACQPICGPAYVGDLKIVPVRGADPIWIDLGPNRLSSRMIAGDPYGETHYMFSPHHGGYIGSGYLYSCQPPLCDEPNSPVQDFLAAMSYGCAVELTWTAGGGNYTIIRCRTDRYPTGYEDGELVVEIPSTPGQQQYYYHTVVPNDEILYYKAFSLTLDAGRNVINDSFVECASSDTTYASCEIAVESSSWGEIKRHFK